MSIASNIKRKREEYDLTQEELAIRAKVSRGLIARIESERILPSLPVAKSLSEALHISLDELVKETA